MQKPYTVYIYIYIHIHTYTYIYHTNEQNHTHQSSPQQSAFCPNFEAQAAAKPRALDWVPGE